MTLKYSVDLLDICGAILTGLSVHVKKKTPKNTHIIVVYVREKENHMCVKAIRCGADQH